MATRSLDGSLQRCEALVCELILKEQLPMTVLGRWQGLSLLFPMEKLFEHYVAECLRTRLKNTAKVVTQAASEHLCRHQTSNWFELRPDLIVSHGPEVWVMDTKWKILNQDFNTARDKYGINQADLYQMFAYGERYMNGRGEMVLIYPKAKTFSRTLPAFEFSSDLRLWVVPFDLESGAVIADGIPEHLKAAVGLAPWRAETIA